MKKATGGTLPAHIFHAFMSDAERNLPPRALVGTALIASSDDPAANATPAQSEDKPADDKPDTLERLLNKIFGGT